VQTGSSDAAGERPGVIGLGLPAFFGRSIWLVVWHSVLVVLPWLIVCPLLDEHISRYSSGRTGWDLATIHLYGFPGA
jgi:hypothetical protein